MLSRNMFFLRGDFGNSSLLCIYKENNIVKIKEGESDNVCIYDTDTIFNCTTDKNGNIYILTKSSEGNIILSRRKNSIWESSIVFKKNKNIENSFFYFEIVKNIPVMLYTVAHNEKGRAMLLYTCMENGKWTEPVFIDEIIVHSNIKFNVAYIEENHNMIFYKTPEGSIKGREVIMYPFNMGKATEYIKNGNYVTDISVFADNDRVHISYISAVRGRMGVYYKYKNDAVSLAKTLWEGRFADDVILYKKDDTVYTMWQTGKGIFRVNPEGIGFSGIQRVYPYWQDIVKCRYRNQYKKGGIRSNECYGLISKKGSIPVYSKEDTAVFIEKETEKMIEATEKRKNTDEINMLINKNEDNERKIFELTMEIDKIQKKYSMLFSECEREKNIINKKLCEYMEREKKYVNDITILEKENYQLNNIIEDIIYK